MAGLVRQNHKITNYRMNEHKYQNGLVLEEIKESRKKWQAELANVHKIHCQLDYAGPNGKKKFAYGGGLGSLAQQTARALAERYRQ